MQVIRDEPGLMHLEEVGGRFVRRQGTFLLGLALAWGIPAAILYAMATSRRTEPSVGAARIAIGVALAVGATYLLFRAKTRTLRIVIDRAQGTWTIAERHPLGVRESTTEIPLREVNRFRVKTVAGVWTLAPGAIAFELALQPAGKTVTIDLEWVDRFEEVLDLAMRMGLAAGLDHYRIRTCTLREFEVKLGGEGIGWAVPIPRMDEPAAYEDDESSAEGRVRRPATPPFDAKAWSTQPAHRPLQVPGPRAAPRGLRGADRGDVRGAGRLRASVPFGDARRRGARAGAPGAREVEGLPVRPLPLREAIDAVLGLLEAASRERPHALDRVNGAALRDEGEDLGVLDFGRLRRGGRGQGRGVRQGIDVVLRLAEAPAREEADANDGGDLVPLGEEAVDLGIAAAAGGAAGRPRRGAR